MPTTQPPGRKPIRPIRAPNAWNGGNGHMSPNNKPKATKQSKPITPVGQAAKFMFTPEIGRSFEGLKFAWDILVGLVAQIYVGVKLIPANHPAADFRNAKDYKLRDIIRIAYNSLEWRADQIPQILIFFAVLMFLVFLGLLFVTLLMNVAVNTAHAQTPSQTGNSANDVLNQIFNVQAGSLIPTALGAMLKAYSNIVLVLAGIILLYHIIHYVVESARHGQPGGKSFNHAWGPVRLVFALGLLFPLSSGLNSGQYIIIYLAKWGSDMASGVYKQFSNSIGQGQSITQAALTDEPQKALGDVFNLYVCAYKANNQAPNSINIPTDKTKLNPNDASDFTYAMVFDNVDQTQGNKKGCGNVSFYYNPSATTAAEQLLNNQFTYFSQNIPAISALAQDYASHFDSQSTNYYQTIQTSQYQSQINKLKQSYSAALTAGSQAAVNSANQELSQEINQDISSIGWVIAPTWIHRIGEQNAAMSQAQLSLPKSEYYGDDVAKSLTQGEELKDSSSKDTLQNQDSFSLNPVKKILQGLGTMGDYVANWQAKLLNSLVAQSTNPLSALITEGELLFTTVSAMWIGWVTIAGSAGLALTVGETAIDAANIFVSGVIGLLFASAVMLAFIVPLIPTIRFIFAVLGWIVLVFIAVMGMPLFALAHLKTGGEGWIGQLQVASSYNMILGIIVRPTLIILGLISGIMLFNVFIRLASTIMLASMTDIAHTTPVFNASVILPLFTAPVKVFILSSFFTTMANTCFKLIDIIPTQAMTWMGTGPMTSPTEDGSNEIVSETKGLGNQMNQAIGGAAKFVALKNRGRQGENRGPGKELKTQDVPPTPKGSGDDPQGNENDANIGQDKDANGKQAAVANQGAAMQIPHIGRDQSGQTSTTQVSTTKDSNSVQISPSNVSSSLGGNKPPPSGQINSTLGITGFVNGGFSTTSWTGSAGFTNQAPQGSGGVSSTPTSTPNVSSAMGIQSSQGEPTSPGSPAAQARQSASANAMAVSSIGDPGIRGSDLSREDVPDVQEKPESEKLAGEQPESGKNIGKDVDQS